ncbi:aldo/keto reductase [Streptacidiphilus sp. EB129]|uniref:aldo/keto reductase n=1 Tax=Streptacidiphilus sp. EB129 TaxID=3156262 RepID=UPI00351896DB
MAGRRPGARTLREALPAGRRRPVPRARTRWRSTAGSRKWGQPSCPQPPSRLFALAWPLRRSPVILPIPGTPSVAQREENVAAASVRLTDEECTTLTKAV